MKNALTNIIYIGSETSDVYAHLAKAGVGCGHFTNGVYSYSSALVVPTVLAGFQYAVDKEMGEDTPALIVAINSNKSMAVIMDQKSASQAERSSLEDEAVRARKVAEPLALQNPNRKVVVVYYDQETPNKLYNELNASGFGMKSLFKWGYGTNPKAGVIEGAENFDTVRGFPLPNDIKPICTELTRMTGQKGSVEVVDLRGTHISADNKCLFRLMDSDLLAYAPIGGNPQGSPISSGQPKPSN